MNKQKKFEELLRKKGILKAEGPRLERSSDSGPFPLSTAQHRIWFHQQYDPASAAYNDPMALEIKGPLDIPVLERTFREIVRRHKILQMRFLSKNGKPEQEIRADGETLTIIKEILPIEPDVDRETQIRQWVNEEAGKIIDISEGPLIRVKLLETAPHRYVQVINIHHIVIDGWSKGILLKEMKQLYEAYRRGDESPLPELPLQYTDYIRWQRQQEQGPAGRRQLEYWKKKLQGAPPLLEIPGDRPRPVAPTGKGTVEAFRLGRDKTTAIRKQAQREGVTPFMYTFALYALQLCRYTGREDIPVGIPEAGRHRVELENNIGHYINVQVYRVDLSGEPTFIEQLQRVRQTSMEAYRNREIPIDKLVEELNPPRNLNVNPLYQVMFTYQNAPMPSEQMAGLTITPFQVDTGYAQVDLSYTLWEEEGELGGTVEFATDLYDRATVKRMIGHYRTLLDEVLRNGDRPITRINMLTETERRQQQELWNNTGTDIPAHRTVIGLIEDSIARNSGETAVQSGDGRISYRELDTKAQRLARALQKQGVGPETRVGICMENCIHLIVGVTAILKTGAAYIPLDPEYPVERLGLICRDANPTVLLSQSGRKQKFEGIGGDDIVNLDVGDIIPEAGDVYDTPDRIEGKPGHAVCVIYTSGTTGRPRGVVMENRNIVNLIASFRQSYNPGPGDRILPLTTIASASYVGEILPMLAGGGAVELAHRSHFLDVNKLSALLSDRGITILSTVPSMIARLNAVAGKRWNPGKLRLLLSGGEALSPGDIDRLTRTVTIVNGYGLTETTICSTYTILDDREEPDITIGKPIINTRIHIGDKYGNPVPVGIPGEIIISGAGISRGYLNNPELTAEKFGIINGVIQYRTGDRGKWLPDGKIHYMGRLDTQVQLHGHRIEPADIEAHIGKHPDVRDQVVVALELAPGDRRLVAYHVDNEGVELTAGQLRQWLSQRIPEFMIPSAYHRLEELPLTPNGKVDVPALPHPTWHRPELDVDFKPPQNEIEKVIAETWKEFLKVEKIGVHDNFFDLGGHSLLLMQVHSRLTETLKHDLTIVDQFRYPTVHSLAGFISDEKGQERRQVDKHRQIQQRAERQRSGFARWQKNVPNKKIYKNTDE